MNALGCHPIFWTAIGGIAGFGGGWVFYRLWRAVLPPEKSRDFWLSVPLNIRGMLTSEDPSDLMRHYRSFLGTTMRHGGRNSFAVLVALSPAVPVFFLLDILYRSSCETGLKSPFNPLSSYLTDMEFAFLLLAILGSAGAAGWSRLSRARPS